MENNIFFKTKNKHNPDIILKMDDKQKERDVNIFINNNIIYNPITGIIPQKITDADDLVIIKKEEQKCDISKKIIEKQNERDEQDILCLPINNKIAPINMNTNNQTNNYIKQFDDFKKGIVLQKNNSKYNDILMGLQDLGIIKK